MSDGCTGDGKDSGNGENKDGGIRGGIEKRAKKTQKSVKGLVDIYGLLDRALSRIIDNTPKLKKRKERVKTSINRVARSLGETLVPAFEAGADIAERVADVFTDLPGPMRAFIAMALGIAVALATVVPAAATVAVALTNISLPVLALIALGAALYAAWQYNLFGMRDTISEFVGVVQPLVARFVKRFRALWNTHLKPLFGETKQTMNALAPVFKAIFAVITTVTKAAWALISTLILQRLDTILTFVRAGLALLRGDWEGAWDIIAGYVERTMDRIAGLVGRLGAIFGDILKVVVRFSSHFGALLARLGATHVSAYETMMALAKTRVKQGLNAVVSLYETAANSIIRVINGLAGSIERQFNEIVSGLNDFLPNHVDLPTVEFGTVGRLRIDSPFEARGRDAILRDAQRRIQDRFDAIERKRKRGVEEATSRIEDVFGTAVRSSSSKAGSKSSTPSSSPGSNIGSKDSGGALPGIGKRSGKELIRTNQPTACSRQKPLPSTSLSGGTGGASITPGISPTGAGESQTSNVNIERMVVNSGAPAPNSRRDSHQLADDISAKFADKMGRR